MSLCNLNFAVYVHRFYCGWKCGIASESLLFWGLDKGQGDVQKMDRVISSSHSDEIPHLRGNKEYRADKSVMDVSRGNRQIC